MSDCLLLTIREWLRLLPPAALALSVASILKWGLHCRHLIYAEISHLLHEVEGRTHAHANLHLSAHGRV